MVVVHMQEVLMESPMVTMELLASIEPELLVSIEPELLVSATELEQELLHYLHRVEGKTYQPLLSGSLPARQHTRTGNN